MLQILPHKMQFVPDKLIKFERLHVPPVSYREQLCTGYAHVTLRSSRHCEHERTLGSGRTRINQVDYQPIIRPLLIPVLVTCTSAPVRHRTAWETNGGWRRKRRPSRSPVHPQTTDDDGSGVRTESFPTERVPKISKRYLDLTREKAKQTQIMCSNDNWTLNKHKKIGQISLRVPFLWYLKPPRLN